MGAAVESVVTTVEPGTETEVEVVESGAEAEESTAGTFSP